MKISRLKTARSRALVVQIEGGVNEGKKLAQGLRTKKRSRLKEIEGDREGKGVAAWLVAARKWREKVREKWISDSE